MKEYGFQIKKQWNNVMFYTGVWLKLQKNSKYFI